MANSLGFGADNVIRGSTPPLQEEGPLSFLHKLFSFIKEFFSTADQKESRQLLRNILQNTEKQTQTSITEDFKKLKNLARKEYHDNFIVNDNHLIINNEYGRLLMEIIFNPKNECTINVVLADKSYAADRTLSPSDSCPEQEQKSTFQELSLQDVRKVAKSMKSHLSELLSLPHVAQAGDTVHQIWLALDCLTPFLDPCDISGQKYSALAVNDDTDTLYTGLVSWESDTDRHVIYLGNMVIMPLADPDWLSGKPAGRQIIDRLTQAMLSSKNTLLTWEAKNNGKEICLPKKTLTSADIKHISAILNEEAEVTDDGDRITLHFASGAEPSEINERIHTLQEKLITYPPVIRAVPTEAEKAFYKDLGFSESQNGIMVLEPLTHIATTTEPYD